MPVPVLVLAAPVPARVGEDKVGLLESLRSHWFGSQHANTATRMQTYKIHEGELTRHIHLRTDSDGTGILFIDANSVYHLNPIAMMFAFGILEKKTDPEIIGNVINRFEAAKNDVLRDLEDFRPLMEKLIYDTGICPIHSLDLDLLTPFKTIPSAPYRMDMALTYRCNNDCSHCYNARERTFGEMDTNHWKLAIDKVIELGIPHVVFTGGEPTLRDDLLELIKYAADKGLVTGLNTNARRLNNSDYAKALADSGLDHIQITVESHDPVIHNHMVNAHAFEQTVAGLKNAIATKLFVMTNTTMLQDNLSSIPDTLDFLAGIGVPTIGLNALIYSGHGASVGTGLRSDQLPGVLEIAVEKTKRYGQRLIWYTPTQYCGFDPQSLDLGIKGCTAALYNMCLEPNADVLPCQSYYTPVGNFLKDEWTTIWNHPLSLSLRFRKDLPAKCKDCFLLAECGGGCPLENNKNEHQLNVLLDQRIMS